MYECYLFDFDYTLVDSTEGIVGCFQRVMRELGRPPADPEAVRRTIGLPMPVAVGRILGTEDEAVVADFIRRYQPYADQFMTAGTHFYPETLPALRALRRQGKKIAIISSKTSHRIQEKLDRDEVASLVDFVIGCREVAALKPDPEGIRQALSRFGLSPANALYVGDSEVDAAAAQNAGVPFAGVTTGTTSAEVLARYPHVRIMAHLGELPGL
ncbi:MAG: HAD-IIIA family hydrolase [Schwartzia sp.]|nr:HAD-IIIA family hydrolase [Schwartzia sp. (in: firmicutes)]